MTQSELARISVALINALLIAFNGVFRTLLGMANPTSSIALITLAIGLLIAAIIAEQNDHFAFYWLFSLACLYVGFAI